MKIYDELIDFIVANVKPEAVLELRASEALHDYTYGLLEKERNGDASTEELRQIEQAMDLEHIMRMVKIKARQYVAQQ
jgi:hypothetical protein